MKILQKPISKNHKSAFFFDGLIARGLKDGRTYELRTYQEGQIYYEDSYYNGTEIISLGEKMFINDGDIDVEYDVTILIDKFFAITFNELLVDEDNLIFDNYDEAIKEFKIFLDVL